MRFTALKQFEWRDEKGKLIAQYVPGLSYTVRSEAIERAVVAAPETAARGRKRK